MLCIQSQQVSSFFTVAFCYNFDIRFFRVLFMAVIKKSKGVKSMPPNLTRQRKVVFCVVSESENHPTADEIFAQAKKQLPTISYATVYNSLHYLKDKGLIREINFGNAASRYDGET